MDIGDALTAAGVVVALCIGGLQVFVALQQKGIADRQAGISSRQTEAALSQGGIQAVSGWLPFLKDADPNVRLNSVIALERIGTEAALVPLIAALSDPNQGVRKRAAISIGKRWTPSTVEILLELLGNQDPGTRNATFQALEEIGGKALQLRNKAAVITGSSLGIGSAIALAFAREGAPSLSTTAAIQTKRRRLSNR